MMPSSDSGTAAGDAGISVLEMLVVLAICALVAGVVAASLQGRRPGPVSVADVTKFVDEARLKAMRSGDAMAVAFDTASLVSGDDRLSWNAGDISVSTNGQPAAAGGSIRIVLFPDGTASGPPVSVRDSAGVHALPLLNRIR